MSKSKKNTKTAGKKSNVSPKSNAELTQKFQSDSSDAMLRPAKRKANSRRGLLPHEQVADAGAAPSMPSMPSTPDEAEPTLEATTAATPFTAAPVAPGGVATPAAANDTTPAEAAPTGEPVAATPRRLGLVSAAIRVLQDAGNGAAMNCPDLVKTATERGLWQPMAGKTPASTLYAAILREIKDKGETSRFTKTDRGKFALNKVN